MTKSTFKDYFNKIRRKIILNSYYTKKIKDGKSIGASFLDWAFITIILLLFFFITIFNSIKHIFLSSVLTGLLMIIYLFISINLKQRKKVQNIAKINEDMSNKEILKEIAKYSNDNFLLYIKNLLEKYYETTFFEYGNNIDFIGEINEEIYGVKCFKNSLEDKITVKNIKNYIKEMKKKNIEEGIIVTNSYFLDEVKEQTNYLLIDFDCIREMLIKTGQYPSKKEIEEIIIGKYKNRKENLKENLSLHRKDKIYKFILLGIVLYIVSFFVSYFVYYRIMAFISFIFGGVVGIYNISKYLNNKREQEI